MRKPGLRLKTPWISTADRLPEESGNYLIADRTEFGFYYNVVSYSTEHRQFNNYDGQEYEQRNPGDAFYDVAYWMPIPPVPEEAE